MYTKEMQTKKVKKTKTKSFGVYKKTPKLEKAYYNFLHNSNQKCAVCLHPVIEVHHITDLYRLPDEPRRDWKRVAMLCPDHHKEGKEGIHILSKERFYSEVMRFEDLMRHSRNLYKSFEKFINEKQ